MRFIATDTLGLLLTAVVLNASVQDRDGAKPVLLGSYLCTGVRFVFADGAFAGRLLDWAHTILRTTLHIVRKPAGGFAVIPRRRAVKRTLRLAHRPPPPGPRPRTRPHPLRSRDPLGRDQHHPDDSPAAGTPPDSGGAPSTPQVDPLKHALGESPRDRAQSVAVDPYLNARELVDPQALELPQRQPVQECRVSPRCRRMITKPGASSTSRCLLIACRDMAKPTASSLTR
jgi:hypothetical protein